MTRTTEYRYTVDGLMEELVCRNGEEEQVTTWEYGTTLAESGVARNDLVRAKVYPDGGDDRVGYAYNALGEVAVFTDQNETERTLVRDALGRLTADIATTLGGGVDGTIRAIGVEYTPRGEVFAITSYSDVGMTENVNRIEYDYNGFGQVENEQQSQANGSSLGVSYAYESPSNVPNTIRRTGITYPSGRAVGWLYDGSPLDDRLDRVSTIADDLDGTPLEAAKYQRLGAGPIVRTEYPEAGLEMTARAQAGEPAGDAGDPFTGLDRCGRLQTARWLGEGGADLERVEFGFDRTGNIQWRRNLLAPEQDYDEHYGYDGLYQVEALARGTLNVNRTAIGGVPAWAEQWAYDETGNWLGYTTAVDGAETLDQTRLHNAANELLAIDSSNATVAHDAAGNMTRMPKAGAWNTAQTLTWDAWNRIVEINEGATLIARYAYDGLNRRIRKESEEGGSLVNRHFFYSDQWQVLEEFIATGSPPVALNPARRFLWGVKTLDDLILRDTISGATTIRHYALNDGKNVTAVVGPDPGGSSSSSSFSSSSSSSSSGPVPPSIAERYACSAFGSPLVLHADFTPKSGNLSTIDWETRFCGYRWDAESGLYQVRFRYYHTDLEDG